MRLRLTRWQRAAAEELSGQSTFRPSARYLCHTSSTRPIAALDDTIIEGPRVNELESSQIAVTAEQTED